MLHPQRTCSGRIFNGKWVTLDYLAIIQTALTCPNSHYLEMEKTGIKNFTRDPQTLLCPGITCEHLLKIQISEPICRDSQESVLLTSHPKWVWCRWPMDHTWEILVYFVLSKAELTKETTIICNFKICGRPILKSKKEKHMKLILIIHFFSLIHLKYYLTNGTGHTSSTQ